MCACFRLNLRSLLLDLDDAATSKVDPLSIRGGEVSFSGAWRAARKRVEDEPWWSTLPESIRKLIVAGLDVLHSEAFIAAHGLYSITRAELREWANSAARATKEDAFISSVEFFTKRLRSASAADQLVVRLCGVAGGQFATHSVGQAPTSPFVLGPRQRFAMNLLLRSVVLRQPVLLVGFTGCGKSELVMALASLLGREVMQLCLTAETDPSDVVGSVVPETLSWRDGPVSEAVNRDCWVLLDNLQEVRAVPAAVLAKLGAVCVCAQADAVVLERLNPLLESPPLWNVAENNEEAPRVIGQNFQVFATLTCSDRVLQSGA